MAVPTFHSVSQNSTFSAGDVNQLLGTHAVSYLNQGAETATGIAATGTLNTNTGAAAQYITQPFTTIGGQTTISRVEFLVALGGTGADTTIGIYANSGGNPTGAALFSITFPLDFAPTVAAYISVPCIATVTASTIFHLVISGTASTSNFLKFSDGTTVGSAAKTSPTGVGGTWTTAGKQLCYNIFNSTDGVLRNTYEDAGARWTGFDYNQSGSSNTTISAIREYTGALRSVRALSYTGGILTGIA